MSSVQVVYYDTAGRIAYYMALPAGAEEINCGPGLQWLHVEAQHWDRDYYVEDQQVISRPAMPIEIGPKTITTTESLSITGIPVGTVVTHPDGEDTVDDGELEWGSTVPGRYHLTLKNFPYRDEEITLEVTA